MYRMLQPRGKNQKLQILIRILIKQNISNSIDVKLTSTVIAVFNLTSNLPLNDAISR